MRQLLLLSVVALCLASCSRYHSGLVDLGLSVKWNGCNLGAKAPHEPGQYYAWGELQPKDNFTATNSLTDDRDIAELQQAGIIDSHGNLTPSHDAAAMTGKGMRIPTRDEVDELTRCCTWQWLCHKGVYGYRVTSKKNGKRIFMPAAGYNANSQIFYNNEAGYYWSSTVEGSFLGHAHDLFFAPDDDITSSYSGRYDGFTIRPVGDKE